MRRWGLVLGALVVLVPMTTWAGGFEFSENGVRALGRAGAFAAKADDLSALAINPAGLARVKGVNVFYSHNLTHLGLDFKRADTKVWDKGFNPATGQVEDIATPYTFQSVSNDAGLFPLGAMFGASYDFGLEDWTFALGVWGPPAVGHTRFGLADEAALLDPAVAQPNGAKYTMVERDILILYYTLSVAYRLPNKRFGVGVDFQFVDMPKMDFDVVVDGTETAKAYPVRSSWDTLARVSASDRTNLSAIIGLWARPWDFLELGLSGRPMPIRMKATGSVAVDLVGSAFQGTDGSSWAAEDWGLSDDGEGVGSNTTDATVRFDLPPWVRFGARYVYGDPDDPTFDVELDFSYEFWRVFDKIDVDMHTIMNVEKNLGKRVALGPITLQKHFEDTWSVKLGGDWQALARRLWVRAGVSYESAAAPLAYTSVDFEAFARVGAALGFTVRLWRELYLSGAFLHVQQFSRTVAESETAVVQQRPASVCASSGGTACDPHYVDWGGTPPVGGGNYSSMAEVISLGLDVRF